VPKISDLLRLNVGFLINQPVGSSRDFAFDIQQVHLPPDLDLDNLVGSAHITRTAQGLLIRARLQATLDNECVRCLSNFPLQLEIDFTELYAFSINSVTDSDLRLPDNGHINLGPLVREYMILEIPISPLCKPTCKGLCPTCGENLNEITCDHSDEAIDPRLSILQSLLDES